SSMDHLNEGRIKWPGVEMPSQAADAASRHGVLRLRSASPHFAQQDRVGEFATCYLGLTRPVWKSDMISDCRFYIADCRLQISDCRFQIADFRLQVLDCR